MLIDVTVFFSTPNQCVSREGQVQRAKPRGFHLLSVTCLIGK